MLPDILCAMAISAYLCLVYFSIFQQIVNESHQCIVLSDTFYNGVFQQFNWVQHIYRQQTMALSAKCLLRIGFPL